MKPRFVITLLTFTVCSLILYSLGTIMIYQKFFAKPTIQVTATLRVINPSMPKDKKIDFKTIKTSDRVGMKKLEKETGISASTMKALEEGSLEEQKK